MSDRVAPSKGAAEVKTQKWTKGEWRASPCSSVVGSLVSFGDIAKGENICAVMPQRDKAECEANAQLIAAAPKLFDALNRTLCHFVGEEERCIECDAEIGTNKTCDTCYVIAEAMSAIEKALGE